MRGLRALGLQKGDAVAIVLPNGVEAIELYLACFQAGWYLTPINNHLAAPEIAYIVNDCEAKAFVASARFAETVTAAARRSRCPRTRASRSARSPASGRTPSSRPATRPTCRRSARAGAVMNYTSGTTGRPKGVRRPLAPIDPDTIATLFTGFLQMFGVEARGRKRPHRRLAALPHRGADVRARARCTSATRSCVMDKWKPEDCLRLIDKYKVTVSHMVPTQLHRMLAAARGREARSTTSPPRAPWCTPPRPCPPEVKRRMLDWWGDSIWEYYAATEGGGTIVSPQEWRKKPGTVGKAWTNAEIKIFDDEGKELPPGTPGTVYMLRGQADFEYYKDKEKTEKARRGRYFTVGDIGYLDEDGYLFLCDRKTDMIISGGVNIYPAEIESVLLDPSRRSPTSRCSGSPTRSGASR